MTDNLRTRIASVLFALNAGEDWNMEPLVWEEISESYRKCWLKQADVVIREMGLRLDSTCHIHDREGKQRCHRYVTEWTADE